MIHAILLAAATAAGPCDAAQTQQQLDACWATQAKEATAALTVAYARAGAGLAKFGMDPRLLTTSQSDWEDARKAICAFEASLVEGGSAAPMAISACTDRMTRARTAHLNALLESLTANKGSPAPPVPLSVETDAELNRLYGLVAKRITPQQQKALTGSDVVWIAYRDAACKLQGGTCLTDLENERIAELKAGWIGEPFW
jgi:uncharacterized protein YecT (DUF1311 family)